MKTVDAKNGEAENVFQYSQGSKFTNCQFREHFDFAGLSIP